MQSNTHQNTVSTDCSLFLDALKIQRQMSIVSLGNELMSNLEPKYNPYFDADAYGEANLRQIWTEQVSDIIQFYETANNSQLNDEQLLNDKMDELQIEWGNILIILSEDYGSNMHSLKQKQRQNRVNKARAKGLNIGTIKPGKTTNKCNKKRRQKQRLKALKTELAKQNSSENGIKITENISNVTEPKSPKIAVKKVGTNAANDNWSDSDSDNDANVVRKKGKSEEKRDYDPFASDNDTNEFEISKPKPTVVKDKLGKDQLSKPEIKSDLAMKICDKKSKLRAPIICVMGDVDAGKTEILDCIRNSKIGKNEFGKITQQIGTTFIAMEYIKSKIEPIKECLGKKAKKKLKFMNKMPGLLFIDTPGHTILSNLRDRGISVCDLCILVIDVHKGLQDTTVHTIKMLKQKAIPFIVCINKIDLISQWKPQKNTAFIITKQKQRKRTLQLLDTQIQKLQLEFTMKCATNTRLYSENEYKPISKWTEDTFISLIPISARTGEGISDLLYTLTYMSKKCMFDRLTFHKNKCEVSILEVTKTKGFGTTIDAIVCDGSIHKNDTMVICGINGPIISRIRELLLPNDTQQMSVKSKGNPFKTVPSVTASIGVRIASVNSNDLQYCVPGSSVYIIAQSIKGKQRKQIRNELRLKVQKSFDSLYDKIDKYGNGVFVIASTLGTLESLIDLLNYEKMSVCGFELGAITKKTVTKVLSKEKRVILAFNVKGCVEVKHYALDNKVTVIESEIIYHLVRDYKKWIQSTITVPPANIAVFPVSFCILGPEHVYRKSNPMIFGVQIQRGILRMGTPICVKTDNGPLFLGCVTGIKCNDRDVSEAKIGQKVSVCISGDEEQKNIQIGRHFEICNEMVSELTRESIDALKVHFKDMIMKNKDIYGLLVALKDYFGITSKVCYQVKESDND